MENLPPIPSPHVDVSAGSAKNTNGKLVCPQCRYAFKLTWKLYVKNPLGKYRCSECRRKLKLKREPWSYVLNYMAYLFGSTFCAAITFFLYPTYMVLAWFLGAFGFGFIVDKYCDGRYSKMWLDD